MIVFKSRDGDAILFHIRAESPGMIGDKIFELRTGQSVFGKSYEEWAALPDGAYDV